MFALLAATSSGAVNPSNLLLAAAQNNRGYVGGDSDGTRRKYSNRHKYVLAFDCSKLGISTYGWTQGNNQNALGNAYTYDSCALIPDGESGEFLSWDSGSASKTIADNAGRTDSDLLDAADFGLEFFPRGMLIEFKALMSVASAGQNIPFGVNFTGDEGSQAGYWYADTMTPSAVDVAGDFTFGGTGSGSGRISFHKPLLIGVPVSSNAKSGIALGDSKTRGYSDAVNRGVFSRGWPHLAAHDGFGNFPIALADWASDGIPSTAFYGSNTRLHEFYDLFNWLENNLGTNDMGGVNAAQMMSRLNSVNGDAKSLGMPLVFQTTFDTRTNSTSGDYLDGADQTSTTSWKTGETADQVNTLLEGEVGDTIDVLLHTHTVLIDEANDRVWFSNGIADNLTNDGTHEYSNGANGVGNETKANYARPLIYDELGLNEAPINAVSPVISGTPQVGELLTCSTGTWRAVPASFTYSYQWKRDGVNISGETSSTYTADITDLDTDISCAVVATNSEGSSAPDESDAVTIGSSGFDFSAVTGAFAMFDADDADAWSSSGGNTDWVDSLFGTHTFTIPNADAPTRGTDARGGYILFATGKYMTNASMLTTLKNGPWTIVAVTESTSDFDTQSIMIASNGGSETWGLRIGNFAGKYLQCFSNNATDNHNRPTDLSTPIIDVARRNGTLLEALTTDGSETSTSSASNATTTTDIDMGRGQGGGGSDYFKGKFRKIFICNAALSDSELNDVCNALEALVPDCIPWTDR